jgi:V/A-type H+/Na+-transporting ATPase subunit K
MAVDVAAQGLVALAAGLALAGTGIGTGIAEAGIGAAAVGAIAEKPELFGRLLVLVVIPESIVVFGLVIAFLLFGQL